MTREELKSLYDARQAAKAKVDELNASPTSFEASIDLYRANREWDAAINAYEKALEQFCAKENANAERKELSNADQGMEGDCCDVLDVKRYLEKALDEVVHGTWPAAQDCAEHWIEQALTEIRK